jgi:ABC-type transporter Mla MlaB component
MSSTIPLKHRVAVSGRQYHLHLDGEADFAVLPELETALDAVDLRSAADIRIDAHGLTFVDLSCTRLLLDFAARAAGAGATVSLEHAPRSLTLLLERLRPGPLRVV